MIAGSPAEGTICYIWGVRREKLALLTPFCLPHEQICSQLSQCLSFRLHLLLVYIHCTKYDVVFELKNLNENIQPSQKYQVFDWPLQRFSNVLLTGFWFLHEKQFNLHSNKKKRNTKNEHNAILDDISITLCSLKVCVTRYNKSFRNTYILFIQFYLHSTESQQQLPLWCFICPNFKMLLNLDLLSAVLGVHKAFPSSQLKCFTCDLVLRARTRTHTHKQHWRGGCSLDLLLHSAKHLSAESWWVWLEQPGLEPKADSPRRI